MIRFLFLFTLFLSSFLSAFAQNQYRIHLNLNQVRNDQVQVSIQTPPIQENTVEYVMPQVIPGSYSRKDFGRFISKFTAYNQAGKKLPVKKEGANIFRISNARELVRLEYLVDDTWDVKNNDNYIFQPGGTNIEAGKNFVMNHPGFYGYLEGYKMLPYEITVDKPQELYGTTALRVNRQSPTRDVLTAENYVRLADAPVMYAAPDTVSFRCGNARIQVGVFSETGAVKAKQISQFIQPLAISLQQFFGQMPVPQYHFIMYFPHSDKSAINQFGGYGALEHSYSSFYFLPELADEEALKEMVLDVAAHEFLHILTPLNIHSEEIGNFDFRNPKMSAHLWLYEGVTEYFSNLVQVQNDLLSYEEFIDGMREKMYEAQKFPEVSFTAMSRGILAKENQAMYRNVYEKGALIGLLLDIRLQELSGGGLNLRDVLLKLSQKYGPVQPFKDENLIPEIVALTYPEINQFFEDYVVGAKPLPYAEYLSKIGLHYSLVKNIPVKTFGNFRINYNEKQNQVWVASIGPEHNVLGLQANDLLADVDGVALTTQNLRELLGPLVANVQTDKEISLTFVRNGKAQTVKGRPKTIKVEKRFVIEPRADATPAEISRRQQLLKR